MQGADRVLIVTTPEVSAVRDADRIIGLIEAHEKGPAQLIVNRIKADMVRRGDMLDISDVLEILQIDLIGIVPEDEEIIVSTNRGTPLALDGRGLAGRAYRDIARRLLGEEVPFAPLRERGLLDRLFGFMRS